MFTKPSLSCLFTFYTIPIFPVFFIFLSNVPLFGSLIVPDIISLTKFSTMNLPNLEIFDNIPSKIFLETIAKGVTGRMNINLGEIAEVSGYYAENKLRIEPLTSLALIDLLSILPDMETRFIYTPASGNLTHN